MFLLISDHCLSNHFAPGAMPSVCWRGGEGKEEEGGGVPRPSLFFHAIKKDVTKFYIVSEMVLAF